MPDALKNEVAQTISGLACIGNKSDWVQEQQERNHYKNFRTPLE